MQTIIIDTETTGLPKLFKLACNSSNVTNWDSARIVQIAYQVFNDRNELVASINQLIQPDGFTIPEASTKIHRITNEKAATDGVSIRHALATLLSYISMHPTKIVCHNVQFDFNVILAELYRVDMNHEMFQSCETHCTMLANTPRGGRWPKLKDVYQRVAGDFDESKAHDASYDVMMTARVYFG